MASILWQGARIGTIHKGLLRKLMDFNPLPFLVCSYYVWFWANPLSFLVQTFFMDGPKRQQLGALSKNQRKDSREGVQSRSRDPGPGVMALSPFLLPRHSIFSSIEKQ